LIIEVTSQRTHKVNDLSAQLNCHQQTAVIFFARDCQNFGLFTSLGVGMINHMIKKLNH